MKRLTIILAAAALAVVPATAGAQSTGKGIPVPDPIVTKLGHTPMVELWDGGGGLPYLGASHPYNAGDWEDTLREYHDSGVYEKQIAKVDAVAEKWVKIASHSNPRRFAFKTRHGHLARIARHGRHEHEHGHKGKHHGRHHGHGKKKLAVVFDIDETTLSNWTAIEADNFVYGPQSQAEAKNKIGTAIEATKDVYDLARKHDMDVFFITGRPEAERQPTVENLEREGFGEYKALVLKPEGFEGTTVDYKSGARADIEDQGYRIVASIGDQYSDLAGGHEVAAFKLPNPFYFLP